MSFVTKKNADRLVMLTLYTACIIRLIVVDDETLVYVDMTAGERSGSLHSFDSWYCAPAHRSSMLGAFHAVISAVRVLQSVGVERVWVVMQVGKACAGRRILDIMSLIAVQCRSHFFVHAAPPHFFPVIQHTLQVGV